MERAWEQDKQEWARDIRGLLLQINKAVDDAGGYVSATDSMKYRQQYRDLLEKAETECPPPDESQQKGKRGRLKRSKSRNLLERLRDFENETLLFMDDEKVPFSNNQGERDIRMTKVQQKISWDKNLLFAKESIENAQSLKILIPPDTSTICCACIRGDEFKSRQKLKPKKLERKQLGIPGKVLKNTRT